MGKFPISATFLTTRRVLLNTSRLSRTLSTVKKGTDFEQRSLRLLQDHFSMSLKRIGGREDGGIDLVGWWWLPPLTSPNPDHFRVSHDHDTRNTKIRHNKPSVTPIVKRTRIRVLGQCKAEKKKIGPNYVRELEGVAYRFTALSNANSDAFCNSSSSVLESGIASPSLTQGHPMPLDNPMAPESEIPTIALLISESPFTKSTILRIQSSSIPFLLLHLPPVPVPSPGLLSNSSTDLQDAPQLGAAIWNPALGGARGLLQGHMEVRWERDMKVDVNAPNHGRPGLWWQGKKMQSWIPIGR